MIANYYSRETVDKLIEVGFYEWTDSQYKTYANEKRYVPDVVVLEEWLRDEKDIYISISPDPDKYLGAKFNVTIYTKDNERQNNINITCSALNNTYVEPNKTFSFCNQIFLQFTHC